MTRFNITLEYAVDIVLWSLKNLSGGELLVPKLPSYRLIDLAKAVSPKCKTPIIGIRPGEKIHEEMISSSDSQNTIELKNSYLILSTINKKIMSFYSRKFRAKKVPKGFVYNSNNNKFLTVLEIKKLITDFEKNI